MENITDFELVFAFIVFNRPLHTQRSFQIIREQRPQRLFIIADGPRAGLNEDAINCSKVREIVENIDWPCKVERNYSPVNLGCKERVNSGLDWVFSHVENAIIIEDDCLPNHDFFMFCKSMLIYYRDDSRIWAITGNNFQDGSTRGDGTYYFSIFNHIWGWATWKRAWLQNDKKMEFWPLWVNTNEWHRMWVNNRDRRYWQRSFESSYLNKIDTWDIGWMANVWYRNGLTVTPNRNLVTNIGFGEGATHTKNSDSQFSKMQTFQLGGIVHPCCVFRDIDADLYVQRKLYNPSIMIRLLNKIKSSLKIFLKKFSNY
jgi:hypothetical protein